MPHTRCVEGLEVAALDGGPPTIVGTEEARTMLHGLMRCVMRLVSGSRMNDGRCRRASRVELPLDHVMEGGHALAFEAAGVVSSVQLWPSRE